MQVGNSAKLCDDSEFAYGFPRFYPLRPLWSKLIKSLIHTPTCKSYEVLDMQIPNMLILKSCQQLRQIPEVSKKYKTQFFGLFLCLNTDKVIYIYIYIYIYFGNRLKQKNLGISSRFKSLFVIK